MIADDYLILKARLQDKQLLMQDVCLGLVAVVNCLFILLTAK